MKSLFLVVCGSPNVGKSTFVNNFIRNKVSATSPRVQTTRNSIRGILTEGDSQIIITDTPGVFEPKPSKLLENKIVSVANHEISQAEEICLIVDGSKPIDDFSLKLLEKHKKSNNKIVVAVNKIDKAKEKYVLQNGLQLFETGAVKEIFYISSLTNKGIDPIRNYFLENAKEDVWYYPEDSITDRTSLFLLSEITREKVFLTLRQELPYNVHVETDSVIQDDDFVKIHQSIVIDKQKQKSMIIGKNGSMLKKISDMARKDMENLLGSKIKIDLFVKIREDWKYKWKND